MKDFRNSPYKRSPDYRGGRNPNDPQGQSSGFFKFILIVIAISGGLYYYLNLNESIDTQEENQKNSVSSFKENFSAFMEGFKEAWNEIEESANQPPTSVDPNITTRDSSTQNVELKASIIEQNVISRGNQGIAFGLVKNDSEIILGRIKITAVYNNGANTKDSFLIASFLRTGEVSPFQIYLSDWDGVSKVEFSVEPVKSFTQDIPVIEYTIAPGKWEKEKFVINYSTHFINKSKIAVKFPQVVYVYRNTNGEIEEVKSHYIATKEEEYTVAPGARKDFVVKLFGAKEIPGKQEYYFTYSATTR
ncbi:MAG: hypothetical protein JJT78_06580 [Leptospira sp.]|nr:hypothetical protein [Leptospira sp.]